MDTEMDRTFGRFVREVTHMEIGLQLLAGSVCRDEEWVSRSLKQQLADHIENIRKRLDEFPSEQREGLTRCLADAAEVWDFRCALVHGRWTLLDAPTQEYVAERPLRGSAAKEYTQGVDWGNGHPEYGLRFNLRSVRHYLSRMRNVQAYLEANMDAWDRRFGAALDDDFTREETARLDALRRGPRLAQP
jgi:hypothetical protein